MAKAKPVVQAAPKGDSGRARTAGLKAARRAAQDAREAANKLARSQGRPTAHEMNVAASKARRVGKVQQPRTSSGNILVTITERDEHGVFSFKGVKPCCNAKSYFNCNHNPKVPSDVYGPTRGRFYMDITLNTNLVIR